MITCIYEEDPEADPHISSQLFWTKAIQEEKKIFPINSAEWEIHTLKKKTQTLVLT